MPSVSGLFPRRSLIHVARRPSAILPEPRHPRRRTTISAADHRAPLTLTPPESSSGGNIGGRPPFPRASSDDHSSPARSTATKCWQDTTPNTASADTHMSRSSSFSDCRAATKDLECSVRELLTPSGAPDGRTKLQRLQEAASFLFTGGDMGGFSLLAQAGRQGHYGPRLKFVALLRHFLETFTIQDLGVEPAVLLDNYQRCARQQKYTGTSKIAVFWEIFTTSNVSIALFLLPKGCPLELHSHPGMVVVSKVLHGSLRVQVAAALGPREETDDQRGAEDFCFFQDPGLTKLPLHESLLDFGAVPTPAVDRTLMGELFSPDRSSEATPLRRQLVTGSRILRAIGDKFNVVELFNGVIRSEGGSPAEHPCREMCSCWTDLLPNEATGCNSTIVSTPYVGNLHRFEAADGDFVAVLDVISPPYEIPESRQCQYMLECSRLAAASTAGQPPYSPIVVHGREYRQFCVEAVSDEVAAPYEFLPFRFH